MPELTKKKNIMSRQCFVTGAKAQYGNNVSHSNRKTRRTFMVNIQELSIYSEVLKRNVSLKVTPAGLRTIEHNGGFDNFLITTPARSLTEDAKKLKKQIEKRVEANKAAA